MTLHADADYGDEWVDDEGPFFCPFCEDEEVDEDGEVCDECASEEDDE